MQNERDGYNELFWKALADAEARERKPRRKPVQETMFSGGEFEVAARRVEKATSLEGLPMFDGE